MLRPMIQAPMPSKAFNDHVIVQARHTSLRAMHPVMGASGELPSEDRQASNANRIGEILIGAGAITIERYRKAVNSKFGHENLSIEI